MCNRVTPNLLSRKELELQSGQAGDGPELVQLPLDPDQIVPESGSLSEAHVASLLGESFTDLHAGFVDRFLHLVHLNLTL